MEEFKAGDLVQLKSGGPTMTVKTAHADGLLFCQWFVGTTLSSDNFRAESVKLIDENRGPARIVRG
jgi:uncharacterized protein YodC (DUF2158 family)